MLKDNLKALRKARGLTQEDFASKLYVVRQTVSKWESGLSVPDAETLLKISEIFEIPVEELLGDSSSIHEEANIKVPAEKLSAITEELAQQSAKKRKRIKALSITGLAVVIIAALIAVITAAVKKASAAGLGIIGGADGPTAIFVTSSVSPVITAFLVVIFIASIAGLICAGRKQ